MTVSPPRIAGMRAGTRGFTLIELMIAMLLGLVLMAGVVLLFAANRQSFRIDEQVVRMQDEARFAIDEIAKDIRLAGFFAEGLVLGTMAQDPALTIGIDCGPAAQPEWILNITDSGTGELNVLTSVDNATAATANNAYSCIEPGEIRAGSDIVAVKRLVGSATSPANLQNGVTYLRSNSLSSVLYTEPPSAALGVAPPFSDWAYRPHIYYIRPAFEDGVQVPSLCRKVLEPGVPPNMTTDCIARGIEDLQIEFGIDTDADGSANQFLPAPALSDMQQVVSARIFLLARTGEIDVQHRDMRTYQLSNEPPYQPGDRFHRRVYSITVGIPNLQNLRRFGI